MEVNKKISAAGKNDINWSLTIKYFNANLYKTVLRKNYFSTKITASRYRVPRDGIS